MKTVVKWGCSAVACLCCGLFATVSTTVGGAAKRHQSIGRALYMVMLLAFMLLAWIMFNLPAWLDSAHYVSAIPAFKGCDGSTGAADGGDSNKVLGWLMQHEFGASALSIPERLCYGTLSVLRVMMGLSAFHAFMIIFMIGATSSDRTTARYELQHSWWSIKFILIGLLVVAAFVGLDNAWVNVYNWIAFFGSLVFILVQILLLIEFAHRTSVHLAETYHRAAAIGRPLRCAMGSGMILVVIGAYVGAIVLLGMTFALVSNQQGCGIAWTISIVTAVLALFITLGSVATVRSSRGGIAPAAVVVLYCAYLTWSSLSPTALHSVGCTPTSHEPQSDSAGLVYVSRLMGLHDISHDAQHFIMLGTAFAALLYATMRSSDRVSSVPNPANDEEQDPASLRLESASGDDSEDSSMAPASPPAPQLYNFSLFHCIFLLASFYAAMVLTGWSAIEFEAISSTTTFTSTPTASLPASASTMFINHTTNSLWIKAMSSWVTLLLYLWTACAPLVCRQCKS